MPRGKSDAHALLLRELDSLDARVPLPSAETLELEREVASSRDPVPPHWPGPRRVTIS